VRAPAPIATIGIQVPSDGDPSPDRPPFPPPEPTGGFEFDAPPPSPEPAAPLAPSAPDSDDGAPDEPSAPAPAPFPADPPRPVAPRLPDRSDRAGAVASPEAGTRRVVDVPVPAPSTRRVVASIAVAAAAVATIGAGEWSLDHAWGVTWTGWTGCVVALGLGVGGAMAQLAASYRPKADA